MNPEFGLFKLRAALPHGGLPDSFFILSLEPEFKPEIMQGLVESGKEWFRAEMEHSPGDVEPTAAVICPGAEMPRLAIRLMQPWVLVVRRGHVRRPGPECREEWRWIDVGRWEEMADPPRFHFRGPAALLDRPATAFLCSTRCPGDKVLEAYDWARGQCDEGGAVISGFHTPVEKDVLAILARRGANILWATARDLPKTTPKELQPAVEEGRLMILSPFNYGHPSRPTRESCSFRNRFVLGFTTDRYLPHVAAGSSLARDLERNSLGNLLG